MSANSKNSLLGVEGWFRSYVDRSPDAVAVVQGDQSFTYKELHLRANILAARLSLHKIALEEPVCILVPMGILQIVAEVAVLRLGGTCVPMDVSVPDLRIHHLLKGLSTRLTITVATEQHRLSDFETVILGDDTAERLLNEYQDDHAFNVTPVETGREHRTHLLHTSGTTGLPKPVEILSKGIMRLVFNKHQVQLKPSDRVAQISPPGFDAVVFEVWATLARGATTIILPKSVVVDPLGLSENLKKHKISMILVIAALLGHVISVLPAAFEDVEYILTGGEAANSSVLQALLENGPPKNLVHVYGPTECTIFTTYHILTLDEVRRGETPIGKPVDGTTVYILDDSLNPVKGSDVGEIYISGDGLARGYYRRSEANEKSFLEIPSLSLDGRPVRVYKTGDLGRWTHSGEIEFTGRTDSMMKIRGYRVEPAEIESVLLKSGMVRAAAILPINRAGRPTYIMAFVVPKEIDAFMAGDLNAYLRTMLPQHMLPLVEAVQQLPFTTHGKLDRRALTDRHIAVIEKAENKILSSETGDTVSWLENLWKSILGVTQVNDQSNFFHLGGSSLQAGAMVVHIRRRFGKLLSMKSIYDHPKLVELANLIQTGQDLMAVHYPSLDIFIEDSQLAEDIVMLPGEAPDWRSAFEGRVFMTGATGFIGVHFLRELIDCRDVKIVVCLVRASGAYAARARVIAALTKYDLCRHQNLEKISTVVEDLAQDNFGLDLAQFDKLCRTASVIFYLAAYINYVQPYERHRPTNVTGTLNAIKMATTGRLKMLHFVSTVAVPGPASYFAGIRTIWEDQDLASFQEWLPYDIGYTQSKWVSEQLIHSMIAKGLPAIIYRPGFIVGSSTSGKANCDDFMCRLFLGCIKLGCRPILPNQSKLLVPVDFITAALLHISSNRDNLGRTFHIVPQTPEEDTDMEASWALLEQCGYKLEALPYKVWLEDVANSNDLLSNPLLPLLPVLQEPVHKGLTRWELYENMAHFNAKNTKKALADCIKIKSGLDIDIMQRQVQDWVSQDLLKEK